MDEQIRKRHEENRQYHKEHPLREKDGRHVTGPGDKHHHKPPPIPQPPPPPGGSTSAVPSTSRSAT